MVDIYNVDKYDYDKILDTVNDIFTKFGLEEKIKQGMNVVIKPDLTVSEEGKKFASVNFDVIKAVAKKVMLCGAKVTIADRVDGIFNEESINEEYRRLGLEELEEQGINLNRDSSTIKVDVKSDSDIDKVEIITAIKNADFVINVPKLKTHTLFGIGCSIYNMFGIVTSESMKQIYGKYSDYQKISKIAFMIAKSIKNQFTIVDAVEAMQGNGPLNGEKVDFHAIIASDSLAEVDYAISKRICKNYLSLPVISEIVRVNMGKDKLENTEVKEEKTKYKQFKMPISTQKLGIFDKISGKKVWPEINQKKCIKCKICALRCPTLVIEEVDHKIVMKNRYKCTRCMHCVNQCPVDAIYLTKKKVRISKKQLKLLNEANAEKTDSKEETKSENT